MYVQLTSSVHGIVAALKNEAKTRIFILKICKAYCEKYCRYSVRNSVNSLKVQSCKLNINKYMITSTQITNTEIFAFTAVLVFRLLSRKVLLNNCFVKK